MSHILPRKASTVIVIGAAASTTNTSTNNLKILFMKRSGRAKFMNSFFVYPGGVVSEYDQHSYWHDRINVKNKLNDNEFRVAGIREVFEETGILLCENKENNNIITYNSNEEPLKSFRNRVYKNPAEFIELCKTYDHYQPALQNMIAFSHWITPHEEKHRYDTMFYVVLLPIGMKLPEPTPDEAGEAKLTQWYGIDEILNLYDQGSVQLAPPTLYTLLELAKLKTYDNIYKELQQRQYTKPITFLPKLSINETTVSVVFPGDPQHPDYHTLHHTQKYIKHRMEMSSNDKNRKKWNVLIQRQNNTKSKL